MSKQSDGKRTATSVASSVLFVLLVLLLAFLAWLGLAPDMDQF